MRADLAPFAADLMLALAGVGILFAIGLVPLRPASLLAALGLAYLTGTAVVSVALIVLLVVGVPFTLITFGAVVLACLGIGAVRWRRAGGGPVVPEVTPWWRKSWRTWSADVWVTVALVAVFGAFAVVGLAGAWKMPIVEWDAWSIWARKTQILTGHDTLVPNFFSSDSYEWIHLEYPLLLPVWEAIHSRAGGIFDMQGVLRHVWLLLVAFVWAVPYLLREHVRPLVWAPVLLLAVAAPGVWEQLLTGYADVPMAMFVCLGALALALWLTSGDNRVLVLSMIMLAAAANTKNEGMMAAVALVVVAWFAAPFLGRRAGPLVVGAAGLAAAILPWQLWVAARDIETEISVSDGLNPSYILDRTDRIMPALEAIGQQLADPARWLYILPLAALVAAACVVSGIGRRIAIFYVVAFFALLAGFLWSYLASSATLEWLLLTSVERVVTVLILLSFAALIHLSGLLFASFAARRGAGA